MISILNHAKLQDIKNTNTIFLDPFRDINNFEIKVGNAHIDSLHSKLSKLNKPKEINDICVGDYCISYQILINKEEDLILYFFKGDGGEYGFGNDQFILEKDRIVFGRNFNVEIENYPTGSSETILSCEESIFYFYEENYTKIITRKILITDLSKTEFSLQNEPFEILSIHGQNILETKAEELQKLLNLKNHVE